MDDDDIRRAERARRGSPYLNTAQAAHYLGISERSMQRLRARGEGPRPRRHLQMVLYHIDDLDAWSCATAGRAVRP
ncbi:MAG TPA: helix-turn-helix domain-containing protein [Sphingomonas sp.]|nr:helix-turn-helix domain-containing protein [Sphingomonas sp.]